jgi:hypothetical protein
VGNRQDGVQEQEIKREREREQRDFELLRHVSTLNVATVVLLAALLRDFSPERLRTDTPTLPFAALGCFGVSLLLGMGGLLYTLGGRETALSVRFIAGVAYFAFLIGLVLAIGGLATP